MATNAASPTTIFVVDPYASDYLGISQSAIEHQFRICFLCSGREALRLFGHLAPDLWIVNVRLPDISGFDLVEMLQPRLEGAATFMVADRYRPQDEIRALSLGVTLYLCKPLDAGCLCQWRRWK